MDGYKAEITRKKKTFNIAQYAAGRQKFKNESNVGCQKIVKFYHGISS